MTLSICFVLLGCVGFTIGSHPPYPAPPAYPAPAPYGYQQPQYKQQYNSYCDPKAPPACSKNGTLIYCLEDAEYPSYEIKGAISQDPLFPKKYSDLAQQSGKDLVDLVGEREAKFNYDFYTGQSKGKNPFDKSHWTGPEGYICPSDVKYIAPRRAKNVADEWRVIVNDVHYYTQTLREEVCQNPDNACRLVPVCVKSKCTQKYVYHRMLSFDPCDPYKGLFIDVFRFPSACSCHISA